MIDFEPSLVTFVFFPLMNVSYCNIQIAQGNNILLVYRHSQAMSVNGPMSLQVPFYEVCKTH